MIGKTAYYRRLFALYRSYRRRDAVVAAPPLRLWIEISSRCNLRCPCCPNRDLPPGEKGDMAWPLFKTVIDQAREFAFEVNLHHRGETLLHPEAGRFIRYASSQGLRTKLHTNATLLRGALADAILDSGLGRLSLSVDGTRAEDYEKSRAGASFERVCANIASFLGRRRETGRRTPLLAIEMMSPAGGEKRSREDRDFIRRFRELGLDELVVKRPHNWAGHLGAARPGPGFYACTFPWNALVVFFNGDVVACAQDFFGRQRLGSAGDAPLLEIWNGLPMQRLRRAHAAGDMGSFAACQECDRVRRRTLGGVPLEYLKRLIFRRLP
jgi:hypothetical protein